MRTFAASFASAIAEESADEFRTAVFYFPASGIEYLSDRAVTVSGHDHTPLVTQWGDIGSTMDRFGQSLDVIATDIVCNNFPHADFGDERFGTILRNARHAVQVELYENVMVSGTAVQELIFEGVAKGPADRSFQQVRVQVVGLTEKYLNGNACRVITAEDFPYAADSAIGDTVPYVWGLVPRTRGRVVKRGYYARPEYTLGAGSTGLLDWNAIVLYYSHHIQVFVGDDDPTVIAQTQTITITFTSVTAFDVEVANFSPPAGSDPQSLGSGTTLTDFASNRAGNDGSNYLLIPSAAWSGVFQTGDVIEIPIDRGPIVGSGQEQHRLPATVIISEAPGDVTGATFDDVKRVYWDGVPVLFEDLDGGGSGGTIPLVLDGATGGSQLERPQSHWMKTNGTSISPGTEVVQFGISHATSDYEAVAQEFVAPDIVDPELVFMYPAVGGDDGSNQVRSLSMELREQLPGFMQILNTDEVTLASRWIHSDQMTPNSTFGGAASINSFNKPMQPGRSYYALLYSNEYFVTGPDASRNASYQAQVSDLSTPDTTYGGQSGKLYGFKGSTNTWEEIADRQLYLESYWRSRGGHDGEAEVPWTGTFVFPISVRVYGRLIDRIRLTFAEAETGVSATEPVIVEIVRGRSPEHGESVVAIEISAVSYNYAIANNAGVVFAFLREDGPVWMPPGQYWLKITSTLTVDPVTGERGGVALLAASGSGAVPFPEQIYPGSSYGTARGAAMFGSTRQQQIATAAGDEILADFTLYSVPFQVDESEDDGTGNTVALARIGCPIPDGVEVTFDVSGLYPYSGTHPNRVIRYMHIRAGVPDARLDLLDDDEASYGTTYRFNGVLEEAGMSWKQAILRAAFEARSAYTWPRDKPMLHFLPSAGGTADMTFGFDDLSVRGKVPEMTVTTTSVEDTVNSIDIRWARDWTQGRGLDAYAEATHVENASAISANGIREKPDLFQFDYVRSSAMAAALGAYYIARYALPKDIATHDTKLPALGVERVDQIAYGADVDIVDAAARFLVTGWKLKAPGEGKTRVELQGEELP